MMLVNPFTRQVLNANPEGCNQHTGPNCAGSGSSEFEIERGPYPVEDLDPDSRKNQLLQKIAQRIGKKAFGIPGETYFGDEEGLDRAERWKLSTLIKHRAGTGVLEYVFKPHSGELVDVAEMEWADVDPSWVDKDGKIYTYSADEGNALSIIDVDMPIRK